MELQRFIGKQAIRGAAPFQLAGEEGPTRVDSRD
jgi:hypothetical protein